MSDREDLRTEIARTIWEASRADEGTISATGANFVAEALLPLFNEVWKRGYNLGRDKSAQRLAHLHNPYTAALDLPGVDVICARCGYDSREPSGRNCPRSHGGDDVS